MVCLKTLLVTSTRVVRVASIVLLLGTSVLPTILLQEASRIRSYADERGSQLEGDIRGAVGGKEFFDINSLLGKAKARVGSASAPGSDWQLVRCLTRSPMKQHAITRTSKRTKASSSSCIVVARMMDMMGAVGGIAGGVLGYMGAMEQADAQRDATRANMDFNYANMAMRERERLKPLRWLRSCKRNRS